MSRSSRRDAQVIDTVTLQQDTGKYVFVNRDGTIAGAEADAFGVTMNSESSGAPVAVCRLGFCPIIVTTAGDNNSAETELTCGANGEAVAIPTSGGSGSAHVIAVSEESTGSNGEQTGAYVDCLSPQREVTWTP